MKTLSLLLVLLGVATARAQSDLPASPPSKTFRRESAVEISLAGATLAGDAFTTRRLTENYHREFNPLARPFVYSAPGTVMYFGASFAGVIYGNRLLRSHPRWRRVFNWSVIASESFWTVHNAGLHSPGPNPCVEIWIKEGILVPPCRE